MERNGKEWKGIERNGKHKQGKVPISHIVALVGDPTYLPCDISTTHEGDSVHLVLWYREDLGTSVYSVDARDRDFGGAEKWSDDTVFSGRAYFMPDQKPAMLGVDHIREEDAGIYRCRVDFQIGQTRNSKVNLTVIEGSSSGSSSGMYIP
ncbi:hypothetical protein M0802_002843 [Mischocyttarus mexicanus]|nr:hypothetical protein M0802_002843 [Mischocyttarus mexicanus]